MKKMRAIVALCCAAVCVFSFAACSTSIDTGSTSTDTGNTGSTGNTSTDTGNRDNLAAFMAQAENFSAFFAEEALRAHSGSKNSVVSPASVYMALSLAAECSAGDTRDEILSALGVTYEQLTQNFSLYYRSIADEKKTDGQVTSTVIPSNSLWTDDGLTVKQSCMDNLADAFYTHSYSVDFDGDNEGANDAIRNFIREQTNGLIDQDFEIDVQTILALINTLYLKTRWLPFGDDLRSDGVHTFTNSDGSETDTELFRSPYSSGRVKVEEKYSAFYASTYDNYKIKFIVPNEGYSVSDVFTAEIISYVNGITDYDAYGTDGDGIEQRYETRCVFPEFECSYDEDISNLLKKLGIKKFFAYGDNGCDFSTLTDAEAYCSSVRHVTKLTVDRKGIEGAAVTVEIMSGSAQPPVYQDFVIDKAFGFIITNDKDETLFSGVVNKV